MSSSSSLPGPNDRKAPNILISGTPGTGKSTLARAVAERTGLTYLNVGDLIKEKGFHAGKDTEFDAFILDEASEDKLLDDMEPLLGEKGGFVVEFHSVDLFPERWFDLVLVLRTDNTVLFDRLKARGYSDKKIEENITAEIMCVVLEEAQESYDAAIVHALDSNTTDDLDSSIERVTQWLEAWKKDHPAEGDKE